MTTVVHQMRVEIRSSDPRRKGLGVACGVPKWHARTRRVVRASIQIVPNVKKTHRHPVSLSRASKRVPWAYQALVALPPRARERHRSRYTLFAAEKKIAGSEVPHPGRQSQDAQRQRSQSNPPSSNRTRFKSSHGSIRPFDFDGDRSIPTSTSLRVTVINRNSDWEGGTGGSHPAIVKRKFKGGEITSRSMIAACAIETKGGSLKRAPHHARLGPQTRAPRPWILAAVILTGSVNTGWAMVIVFVRAVGKNDSALA
ncbi:hypothetical protein C8R46DRAFT_1040784 [Mycena filopes]|nr:hypothetical protein C8R46DRAFT_1040784 [Mycena filopes]